VNKRTHTTARQQFRSIQNEDGTHTISGYAALFDVLSNELAPGLRERIAPGAFDRALPVSDVTANINHDDAYLLGRTSSGTLKLSVDERGLLFDVTLPDTTYARDLGELMKRGDMQECSFAFTVSQDNIASQKVSDTEVVQTIKDIERLYDVSVVTRGAYSQTFSVFRNETTEELPQTSESHTANEGEAEQGSEVRTNNDHDVALAIAKLELQYKSIELGA
jgi:uncharacterized protein